MICCSELDKIDCESNKIGIKFVISPVSFNVPMPLHFTKESKHNEILGKMSMWIRASFSGDGWCVGVFNFFSTDYYCCCFCLVWMPTRFDMVSICAQFALKFIDGMEMKLNNKLSNITIVWVNLIKWNKKYLSKNIKCCTTLRWNVSFAMQNSNVQKMIWINDHKLCFEQYIYFAII